MPKQSRRNHLRAPSRLEKAIYILSALVFLSAASANAAEVIPPKPNGYFNDYAGVVSKEAANRFNEQLAQFERETSDQVVVAVFPKMESDSDIADYTQRVAQAWGIGQKEQRNGVVLSYSSRIVRCLSRSATAWKVRCRTRPRSISPSVASNHCFGLATMKRGWRQESIWSARQSEGSTRDQEKLVAEQNRGGGFSSILPFIVFVIVLIIISRLARKRGGYGYSSGGGGPIFIPGGGGGGWSSGGGNGGGFSGFSGGGGGFGGGGAG